VEVILAEEILTLNIDSLPYVSDEEQKEIESVYGQKPDISEEVTYEESIKIACGGKLWSF
jgi:hypothetical protein